MTGLMVHIFKMHFGPYKFYLISLDGNSTSNQKQIKLVIINDPIVKVCVVFYA